MQLQRYTIALLLLRSDAPRLDETEAAKLQDAHMAHLADLHEAGHLLASGPVQGPANRELRGFSILKVDPEQARALKEADPAVRAGRFRIEVYPWLVPEGLLTFTPGRMPRSVAEVSGG